MGSARPGAPLRSTPHDVLRPLPPTADAVDLCPGFGTAALPDRSAGVRVTGVVPGPAVRHSGRVPRPRLIRALVTVLALGVVLVAADLAARSYATARFADRVRAGYDLPADPRVAFAGGSFLWQALRGRFEEVTVEAADVPAGEVTLHDVRVRVPEVDVPLGVLAGGAGTVDVAAGTVRARVGFDDLAGQVSAGGLDVGLERAGDAIRATTTVRVFTLGLDLAVTVRPELDGSTVRLEPVEAEVAGADVPLGRAEDLLEAAGFGGWSVALSDVPPEVELDGLQVVDTGVLVRGTLTATAVDVG